MNHQFDLVAVCVSTTRSPPESRQFVATHDAHYVCGEASAMRILTVDAAVWKSANGEGEPTVTRTCPDVEWIEYVLAKDVTVALAMCDEESRFRGLSNARDETPVRYEISPLSFFYAGFDVIDASGISGLVNLRLTADERKSIELTGADYSPNGLLADYKKAKEVAAALDKFANEHAPFFAVQVWIRMQKDLEGLVD